MKVTYLICNHNYEKYIEGALKSALNQTYPCHICVIDDCSTDNSIEKILALTGYIGLGIEKEHYKILQNDKFTVIQLKKQSGPSFSRNCGILETREFTDIYAVLDADDENYHTKVEKCLVPFKDSRVGVVYADYDILNMDTGNLIREYKEPYNYYRLRQDCIVHSGSLIRKEALDKVAEPTGWYDNNLTTAEDYDLWLRIAEYYMIVHIPEALSLVRVHNQNSVNYRSKEEWNKNWKRVQIKLKMRDDKRR